MKTTLAFAGRFLAILFLHGIGNAFALPPVLVTPRLANATLGAPYNATLMISANPALGSASATGLPAGLTATHDGSGNLVIGGTPTASGNFTLAVAASNADGTITPSVDLHVDRWADNVLMVATSVLHTCAVVAGGVQCWGFNDSGQLGNNSTTDSFVPVSAIAAGSGATAVAAGNSHTCAVVAGGVKCWGLNDAGQLGNNSTSPSLVPVTAIAAGSGVTAVATGSGHTCAVVAGGAQCWGNNGNGQLGNSSTTDSPFPVTAIAVGGGVTAVVAGDNHTCALVAGGVQCWGWNLRSQLGNNSTTDSPFPVTAIAAGSGVTAVAAISSHTCALAAGGVQCWGWNLFGQLGNNSTTDSPVPVTVIAAGSGATSVAAGGGHTCALVAGGVQCWGSNSSGQLGNIGTADSLVPVAAIAAGTGVTAVAAGGSHTCALAAGRVQCWGNNDVGQLGNTRVARSLVPVTAIAAGSGLTAVAAGGGHTCAVVAGGVQCWGVNFAGQLGNNSTGSTAVPVIAIAAGSGATAVAAGNEHTCAVVAGGVQCWGYNGFGRLGNNSSTDSLVPVTAIAAGSGATAVAAGSFHSCAVVAGGVKCWGLNDLGQLGNNSTSLSLSPVAAIAAGGGATAVTAGDSHTCAVVAGGVKCWGANFRGQLGNSSMTDSHVPVTALAAGTGVSAVEAGSLHSCAAVAAGVQCWGRNSNGQLGNNSSTDSLFPVTAIAAGSGVTAVAAGTAHSCAMVADEVRCWGSNSSGRLGNNSTTDSLVPVTAILAGSGVTAVAAGVSHTCAVVAGGGTACWGANDNGQLADGNTYGRRKIFAAIPTQTAVAVATSGTPSIAGSAVTFTATVSGNTPTGSIHFKSDGGNLPGCGAVVLVSGSAQCTVIFSTVGTRAITAEYGGDSVNVASVGTLAGGQVVIAPTIAITPATLPDGNAGTAYTTTNLGASGGTAAYTFAVTAGTLPGGLGLTSGGVLGGPAGATGTFNFTVTATDAYGFTGSRAYAVTIAPAQFTLTVDRAGSGGGAVTSSPAGIDCGATCSASFVAGTLVTLTATPAAGSSFTGWSGACTGTGSCEGPMDSAHSVTATFALATSIPRLANISTRMQVLTGNDVMIGGFVISGATPKTVAIVATGPSLVPFGIANALANPTLQLVRSSDQTVLATNDNWQSAANAAQLTAAGFAPSNTLESAILTTLAPGAYTAIVSGVGGTGVGIVAVYEVDHPEVPLINISTRGRVLTGNDVMIGGFIIQGSGPQQVAIVATGPSLAAFGIASPLANPTLTLVRSSDQSVLATNDDWQGAANAAALQAAGFAPSNPLESAILVTLQPGAYTAILSGSGGGTGVGIIGVYTVP